MYRLYIWRKASFADEGYIGRRTLCRQNVYTFGDPRAHVDKNKRGNSKGTVHLFAR